jgi:hypothetical protein
MPAASLDLKDKERIMRWRFGESASVVVVGFLIGVTLSVTGAEPATERELHIVCVYEGNTRTGTAIHGERATVSVERPGKSVVLFLGASSEHSVTWEVLVGKDTKVESVILGGRKKQAVKELPEGTKLVEAFGREQDSLMGYYRLTALQTRQLIRQLVDRTELPVSSFYGAYQPKGTIQITEARNDPKLDPDFPQVDPKEKFPETSFPAVHFVPGRYPHEMAASLGEYSLQGPKLDTLKTVKGQFSHFTFDPDAKQWYGMNRGVFALDLQQQTADELPLGMDVPEFSGTNSLAFDSKRQRLIVASRRLLYACSIKDWKWSVVASLNSLDLSNLCYSPHHDSFYSVVLDYDGNSHTIPTLLRLNAAGAVLSRDRLIRPFVDGMFGDPHSGSGVQLLPLGEQLVLMSSAGGYDPSDGSRGEPVTLIFHVGPKLGFARLSWKSTSGKSKPKSATQKEEDTSQVDPAAGRPPVRVSTNPSTPKSEPVPSGTSVALKKDGAPELRFYGPYFPGSSRPFGESNGSWGEFTLAGPDLNTLRPMPKGIVRMAFDAEKKQFYGLDHHNVFQVDLVQQTTTELEIGTDAPKLSWPSGITFDSKRRRLLVLGSGLIYQCDVDKEHKWSVVREVHRHWAHGRGLVYEPKSDSLFLLSQSHGGQPTPVLSRLDSDGAVVKSKTLVGPEFTALFGQSPADSNAQLIAVDGKVVLLAYPSEHGEEQAQPPRSKMFLYDPQTDRIQPAWEK